MSDFKRPMPTISIMNVWSLLPFSMIFAALKYGSRSGAMPTKFALLGLFAPPAYVRYLREEHGTIAVRNLTFPLLAALISVVTRFAPVLKLTRILVKDQNDWRSMVLTQFALSFVVFLLVGYAFIFVIGFRYAPVSAYAKKIRNKVYSRRLAAQHGIALATNTWYPTKADIIKYCKGKTGGLIKRLVLQEEKSDGAYGLYFCNTYADLLKAVHGKSDKSQYVLADFFEGEVYGNPICNTGVLAPMHNHSHNGIGTSGGHGPSMAYLNGDPKIKQSMAVAQAFSCQLKGRGSFMANVDTMASASKAIFLECNFRMTLAWLAISAIWKVYIHKTGKNTDLFAFARQLMDGSLNMAFFISDAVNVGHRSASSILHTLDVSGLQRFNGTEGWILTKLAVGKNAGFIYVSTAADSKLALVKAKKGFLRLSSVFGSSTGHEFDGLTF